MRVQETLRRVPGAPQACVRLLCAQDTLGGPPGVGTAVIVGQSLPFLGSFTLVRFVLKYLSF